MTASTESDASKFLNSIELPVVSRAIGDVGRVVGLSVGADSFEAQIELGFPIAGIEHALRDGICAALTDKFGVKAPGVTLESKIVSRAVQGNLKPVAGISNIVAVASGKGGVGKSTVAANIALGLSAAGARVGILDADIYGPSQPHMLGVHGEQPVSTDGKTMQPLRAHGIDVMSIGFLVDADQPMVWRGPMVTSALNQLMYQTTWADLDYLVVDMPPGTGDIQLTLSQKIPVAGAVIVTTPQDIAALDARKGLAMFRKVSIPVLGVVENMSLHVCPACGHEEAIFGVGGARKIVEDFGVPLLGELPLDARIQQQTDSGTPTVVADPTSPVAIAYRDTGIRIAAALATQKADYSSKFGNIVVEGA